MSITYTLSSLLDCVLFECQAYTLFIPAMYTNSYQIFNKWREKNNEWVSERMEVTLNEGHVLYEVQFTDKKSNNEDHLKWSYL